MTGLLLFALFTGWLYIAIQVSVRLARRLPQSRWRPAFVPVSIIILMVLPVLDEIVIGVQFQRICRENDHVVLGNIAQSSRMVYLADLPSVELPNPWVHVIATPWRFLDAKTGETIVSYDTLEARGGWLSRFVPVAAGHAPLLFKSYCRPREAQPMALLKRLGLTQMQRSEIKKG